MQLALINNFKRQPRTLYSNSLKLYEGGGIMGEFERQRGSKTKFF